MNRHHLPRAARGSRQSPKSRLPRVLGAKSPIRALPLPFCFFNSQLSTLNFKLLTSCRSTFHPSNVPTFRPSKVQTIPSPRSHSRFGTHPSRIPEKIPPFFSCTYVEPILQPLCFQTHAWNGGYRVCVATTSHGQELYEAKHLFAICCGRDPQELSTHTDSVPPSPPKKGTTHEH